MAALHWDYVLNDGFPLFRLQMHVTTRFFSVGCPGSRGNLPESCSGKLTQGVTSGLKKNQLMKSIIGILLNPSGKVVCISELTFLADSGILALALVTAYVSATVRYPANFSRVIQSVPY